MGEFAESLRLRFEDVESARAACSRFCEAYTSLRTEIGTVVVGQDQVVDETLIALFAGGHVLLEGVPGLGKTLLVKTLAEGLGLAFSRIQFTPDLMPADITGTTIVVEDGRGHRAFQFRTGPIFANIVLADEINRATPKSQSAMLEAMQEGSVSTDRETRSLPDPFLVLATQNPIEQEGTYPLPEAQLDRFLFKVWVPYAARAELTEIVHRTTRGVDLVASEILDGDDILAARRLARRIVLAPTIKDYAIRLVLGTHPDGAFSLPEHRHLIRVGASPRAAQALVSAARVVAIMDGRFAVSVEDIRRVAHPALRHRIVRTFEAETDQVTSDDIIDDLIEGVSVDPGDQMLAGLDDAGVVS